MSHDNQKPPFRADHVGSMIRSPELIEAREAFDQGALNRAALRELEDAAIRDVVAMQERVGLQSITDGELRRFNWRDGFFESVDGFSETRIQSSFSFTEFDGKVRRGTPVPVVEGKLSRRKSITADDFAFTKGLTDRTVKATLPSPTVNHFFFGDKGLADSPYEDRQTYFSDIAQIYRDEIADLAKNGCTYLQIDEVCLAVMCDPKNQALVKERGEDPDQLIDQYIDLINDAIADRPSDMVTCIHLCRGNSGHGQASGGYEPVAERLFQGLNADGYFMEYDTDRAGGFEPLRFLPKGKSAALGLISTKLSKLEPADSLKRRIDEASKYADPNQLGLCPQCGFASSYKVDRFTFDDQERKLAHMVQVADEIWG